MGGFGTVVGRKQDDMVRQQSEAQETSAPVAIVTDSSGDLPEGYLRENGILTVPLKVLFGEKVYYDRIDINQSEFLRLCETSPHHPTTSQPTVGDFVAVFESAAQWAKEIVVVCLSGGVSGTYEAAVRAAEQFRQIPVHAVDSRSLTVAQGLLVQEARSLALAGATGDRIAERLDELRGRLKVFISLKNLDFVHRGGRVGFGKSLLTKLLRIKPVISFDAEGKVVAAAKAFGDRGVQAKVMALAKAEVGRYTRCRVGVAHVGAPGVAELYRKNVGLWTGLEDIPVVEATPVLGAHSGPGAAGIAVLGLE
jgi:hypothetical protein